MKFSFALIFLCLAITFVTIANGQQKPNVISYGQRIPYDRRVFYQIYNQARSYVSGFGITKDDVEYPNKVSCFFYL